MVQGTSSQFKRNIFLYKMKNNCIGIGFICETDGIWSYDLGYHLQVVVNLRSIRSPVGLTKRIRICLTLIYMGYFDNLFYIGGGAKKYTK